MDVKLFVMYSAKVHHCRCYGIRSGSESVTVFSRKGKENGTFLEPVPRRSFSGKIGVVMCVCVHDLAFAVMTTQGRSGRGSRTDSIRSGPKKIATFLLWGK